MKIVRLGLIGLTMLSTAGCVWEHDRPEPDRGGYYQPRGGDRGDVRDRDHYGDRDMQRDHDDRDMQRDHYDDHR